MKFYKNSSEIKIASTIALYHINIANSRNKRIKNKTNLALNEDYFLTIFAPKGIKESFINLNATNALGIPTILMQQMIAAIR